MNENNNGNNSQQEPKSEQNMESLPSQTFALEMDGKEVSGKLINYKKINGTPFTLISVGLEELGLKHALTMGNNRITPFEEDIELLYKKTEGTEWNLLTAVISHIVETILEYNEIIEKKAKAEKELNLLKQMQQGGLKAEA